MDNWQTEYIHQTYPTLRAIATTIYSNIYIFLVQEFFIISVSVAVFHHLIKRYINWCVGLTQWQSGRKERPVSQLRRPAFLHLLMVSTRWFLIIIFIIANIFQNAKHFGIIDDCSKTKYCIGYQDIETLHLLSETYTKKENLPSVNT